LKLEDFHACIHSPQKRGGDYKISGKRTKGKRKQKNLYFLRRGAASFAVGRPPGERRKDLPPWYASRREELPRKWRGKSFPRGRSYGGKEYLLTPGGEEKKLLHSIRVGYRASRSSLPWF